MRLRQLFVLLIWALILISLLLLSYLLRPSDWFDASVLPAKKRSAIRPKALLNVGFSEEEAATMKIYKGKGCPKCNNTGYKGRIALYEVMQVSPTIRDMILSGASVADIRKQAIDEGMLTLRQSGLTKIHNGVTTIEEVIRESF